jgi:hypothetical protein
MALVNTDFPSSRKGNLESENIENISFEVNINDKKWLIMGIYKAPSISDNDFSNYFIKNIDECIRYYENCRAFWLHLVGFLQYVQGYFMGPGL